MILDSPERIAEFTQQGWWGTETLGAIFRRNVAAAPQALAVVDPPNRAEITDGDPQRLTYAELNHAADRLAATLVKRGVWKDDILAVQLPNTVELVLVYMAAARIGAIVSPFPAQYREYEIAQLVNLLEARVFITTTRIGKHPHAQMVAELLPQLPSVRNVLAWGAEVPAGVESLDAILALPHDADLLDDFLRANTARFSANDIFTICWTSGTEGQPKGVPRSHNEWLMIGVAMQDAATLDPGCRILNPFPLVNMAGIGGMLMSWLLTGGTFAQHHPLSLPVFLQQIAQEQINFTVAPPALLNLLLQNEALLASADISSIKTLGSGSAPLSPWMVKTWQEKYGIAIVNFFGANEGTTLVSGPREIPDPEQRALFFPRFGVAGYSWPARIASRIQTKLFDAQTGREVVTPDTPGELLLKGATLFPGYFRAPELTARAIDAEGYFHTGDMFQIAGDDQQFYQFVGRSKDIIIRGGVNISSEEIEALIQGFPPVAEVAIVGYPDDALGERACAVVVPRPGETVTLDDLTAYLRDRKIAAYKLPERLMIIDALPRNPLGKVLKQDLRDRLKQGANDA